MKIRLDICLRGGPTLPALLLIIAGLVAPVSVSRAGDTAEPGVHPAVAGTLVIRGLGETAGLDPVVHPSLDARIWSWDWGALTVFPEAFPVADAGDSLVLAYGADLGGASRGRRLLFQAGTYPVDGPLLLADANFQLFVYRGALEIGADRLTVGLDKKKTNPASQYLLFLGILLITMFMMMKTRSRLKKT